MQRTEFKHKLGRVFFIGVLAVGFTTQAYAQQNTRNFFSNGTALSKPNQYSTAPTKSFFEQDSSYVAPDTMYAFFNHNSSVWDNDSTIKLQTLALDSVAHANRIPSIMTTHQLSDEEIAKDYFVQPSQVDYPIFSEGGAHNIKFPKLKRIIFSGGYIEWCLCEAIRDVSRGTEFQNDHPLKVYLPADAIFVSKGNIRAYYDPESDAAKTYPIGWFDTIPLTKALHSMSEKRTTDFFEDMVFNVKDNKFCTGQYTNHLKTTGPQLSDYTIKIMQGEKILATIGSGAKKIDVMITDLAEVKNMLPPQGFKRATVSDERHKTTSETEQNATLSPVPLKASLKTQVH